MGRKSRSRRSQVAARHLCEVLQPALATKLPATPAVSRHRSSENRKRMDSRPRHSQKHQVKNGRTPRKSERDERERATESLFKEGQLCNTSSRIVGRCRRQSRGRQTRVELGFERHQGPMFTLFKSQLVLSKATRRKNDAFARNTKAQDKAVTPLRPSLTCKALLAPRGPITGWTVCNASLASVQNRARCDVAGNALGSASLGAFPTP